MLHMYACTRLSVRASGFGGTFRPISCPVGNDFLPALILPAPAPEPDVYRSDLVGRKVWQKLS